MTKDEALKLALEALEEINKLSIGERAISLPAEIDTAMDAIREALAQPEQEPVAWLYIEPDNPHLNVHYDDIDVSQFPNDEWFPVYKSPPQRTWVGLTVEEIKNTYFTTRADFVDYARAIEAKLKEKNT